MIPVPVVILLVFVGLVLYAAIGALVASGFNHVLGDGIFDRSDGGSWFGPVIAWPIFVAVASVVAVGFVPYKVARSIIEYFATEVK